MSCSHVPRYFCQIDLHVGFLGNDPNASLIPDCLPVVMVPLLNLQTQKSMSATSLGQSWISLWCLEFTAEDSVSFTITSSSPMRVDPSMSFSHLTGHLTLNVWLLQLVRGSIMAQQNNCVNVWGKEFYLTLSIVIDFAAYWWCKLDLSIVELVISRLSTSKCCNGISLQ